MESRRGFFRNSRLKHLGDVFNIMFIIYVHLQICYFSVFFVSTVMIPRNSPSWWCCFPVDSWGGSSTIDSTGAFDWCFCRIANLKLANYCKKSVHLITGNNSRFFGGGLKFWILDLIFFFQGCYRFMGHHVSPFHIRLKLSCFTYRVAMSHKPRWFWFVWGHCSIYHSRECFLFHEWQANPIKRGPSIIAIHCIMLRWTELYLLYI